MDRNNYTENSLTSLKKRLFIYLPRSRIKSGTPKYPTTQDVFRESINILTELGNEHIVCFRIRRRNWWAIIEWTKMSVELSEGIYFVHIKFPNENSPKIVFEEDKIRIPEGWSIRKLGRRWAKFDVKGKQKETIAPFLESIYEKFYAEFEDYCLIGQISLSREGAD